jgi:hypothetical protein
MGMMGSIGRGRPCQPGRGKKIPGISTFVRALRLIFDTAAVRPKGWPVQCEWGLPVPHMPQEPGVPVQEGSSPLTLEANTESFFASFVEPQCGHWVPSQRVERTSISLSFSQPAQ